MAFGLIRVRELLANEIGSTDIHNARKYDDLGIETPVNIKKDKSHTNSYSYYDLSKNEEPFNKGNLKECIDNRLKSAGVKIKKNSVNAIEFVVSASPEFFNVYSASGYFANCHNWLSERYGEENIVARYEHHHDESTPHAHFIVVPIVEKEIKWKNQKGQGVKTENRLCARDLTGNKEKLVQLQEDYYNFIYPYGKRYGVEFYRGTKASNELKQYTKNTIHELGHLRHELNKINEMVGSIENKLKNGLINQNKAIELQSEANRQKELIIEKQEEIKTEFNKLNNAASNKEIRRELYNKGNKWKKGIDFEMGI